MSLAEYEYEVHSSVDVFEDLRHVGERLKSMAESIQLVDKNELKKLAEATKKNQKKLAEKLAKENKIAAAKKAQEDKIIARKVRAAEDKRIKEYLKMLKEKEKEAKKLEKKLKKEAKKEAKKKKIKS